MAYAIGGRGCRTCRVLWRHVLWRRVPAAYTAGLLFTDFWSASAEVLPAEQHQATGKGAGQTCHVERFNNVLRQRLVRLVRLVRKTLSFSETDKWHDWCLRLFLHEYNLNKKNSLI